MAEGFDEKSVFLEAASLPAAEREAYLRRVCPDEAARARIDALLAHHSESTLGVADTASTMTEAGPPLPDRIDEFRVVRVLGEGGMGMVYLAEDTILGRMVALKVLARHLVGSEQALGRFRDEARSAAALRHPGIVPVFKFGFDGRNHYLVSEFVDGPTLRDVIGEEAQRRKGGAGTHSARQWHTRCAEIVAGVADALECSHRAGIVHRDVKPSNILLDPQAGPRLTDFGIAKNLTPDALTHQTTLVGSCHYMSPEQATIAASRVDQRSDIFSLGVILYEMLSTVRPFDGPDIRRILQAVTHQEPRKLRAIDPRIPRDLETVCHKALEKDPDRRYQSAAHFAADLRCVLAGRPILATPPGLARRARRWAMAHRGAAVGTTIVALVAAVGGLAWGIVSLWNSQRAWLTVEADEPGCTVVVQEVDPATLAVSSTARRLGAAPVRHARLRPGVYRVTVAAADPEVFCEFNAVLLRAGSGSETTMRATRSRTWTGAGGSAVRVGRLAHTDEATRDGMVLVPPGEYDVGRTGGSKEPPGPHPVRLQDFYIDKTEVSNREYKEFVDATGHRAPPLWDDGLEGIMDRPVVNVTLEDAEEYARWRGKRLPTSLEWEAAARGLEGNLYPWGNEEPATKMEFDITPADRDKASGHVAERRDMYRLHTADVHAPDRLQSALGLSNTFGNVGEITGSVQRRTDATQFGLILKGRWWSDPPDGFTLRKDISSPMDAIQETRVGFRCARSSRAAVAP